MSGPASPAAGGPRLVVRGGADDGRVVPLDEAEVLLGSDPGCAVCVDRPDVSPIHARLLVDGEGVTLVDAHSRTGTFVNGEPLGEPRHLDDGDVVSLGAPGSTDGAQFEAHLHGPTTAGRPPETAKEPAPRRPSREDFVTELPSIASQVERVATVLPPPVPSAAPASRRRPAVAAAVGLAVGLAGFALYSRAQAPSPVIEGLLPPKVEAGQTLTIRGSGFSSQPSGQTVSIGDLLGVVATAAPDQLTVEVPPALAALAPRDLPVRVELGGQRSNAVYVEVFLAPRVDALVPDLGEPGDIIVARGANLAGDVDVTVAGHDAERLEASSATVRFRVPPIETTLGQEVPVAVRVGEQYARSVPLLIGRPPLVLRVDPPRGDAGTRVTLSGRGLRPPTGRPRVRFGGREALVFEVTPTALQVGVPGGEPVPGQAELPVVVDVGGATSEVPARFTLVRPSAARYLPHFFALPDADGAESAQVACELAPVLRLSGGMGALSFAERAARVAEALDTLVLLASRQPARLETRTTGAVGVGVVGRPLPLVTVSEADAAAYAEASGRPIAPAELAEHWRVLLQDLLDLFASGGRPLALLERYGPEGDVLDSLFRESLRHQTGAGVPASMLSPPPAATSRALAGLARRIPKPASSGAAAVVGVWNGALTQPGQPERTVRLRLVIAGGRLSGTLATRAGSIEVSQPLAEVAYRDRELRLGWNSAGTHLTFQGRLDGDRLAGSVAGGGIGGQLRLQLGS